MLRYKSQLSQTHLDFITSKKLSKTARKGSCVAPVKTTPKYAIASLAKESVYSSNYTYTTPT